MKKPNNSKNKTTNREPRINWDGNWKILSKILVQDFIAFFLPQLHPDIDYSQPIIFLDQDVFEIEGKVSKKGANVLDLLIQVTLNNGDKELVYIHVEIERGNKGNFSERMYNTRRRLEATLGKNVIGLAIFLGDKIPKSHNRYLSERYGDKMLYEYNTYCVRDQKDKIEELKQNPNPFAIAILACLYVNTTKHDSLDRKAYKLQLMKLALKRKYAPEKIEALLKFIEYIVVLQPTLGKEVWQELKISYKTKELKTMEMSKTMQVLCNVWCEEKYGLPLQDLGKKAKEVEKAYSELEVMNKKLEVTEKVLLKYKEEQKTNIIRLYKNNYSQKDIMWMLNCNEKTIKEALKDIKTIS